MILFLGIISLKLVALMFYGFGYCECLKCDIYMKRIYNYGDIMVEVQFIEITYIGSKDKDLFKIGEKNVEKFAIQDNEIIIHFNDNNRKYRRVIPFSSILYFDTNYVPESPVLYPKF